jgi:DNA adenine methylase
MPTVFVEPFAGGGIVGLSVAFERLAKTVVMIELDEQVAAVWKTILGRDSDWLVDRILSFRLTEEAVREELASPNGLTHETAFRTLLKNRTFHGGILAEGSSLIRSGENGKGLRSRWYPETLARRIRAIAEKRDRIAFIEGDGTARMLEFARKKRAAFFIDPPYTVAGKRAGTRLYKYHTIDHETLFAATERLAGDFLMTYDNAPEVRALAKRHGFQVRTIPMKGTHNTPMLELIIGRDLSWVC